MTEFPVIRLALLMMPGQLSHTSLPLQSIVASLSHDYTTSCVQSDELDSALFWLVG